MDQETISAMRKAGKDFLGPRGKAAREGWITEQWCAATHEGSDAASD